MMDIFAIDLMPSKGKSDAPTASGRPDESKTAFRDALTDARATADDRRPETPRETRPETPRAEEPARTAEAPANPDTPAQDTPAEQEPAANGQANAAEAANTAPASPSAAPAEVRVLVDLAHDLGTATPGFEGAAVETLVAPARQLGAPTLDTDAPAPDAPSPQVAAQRPDVDALVQAAKTLGGTDFEAAALVDMAPQLAGQVAAQVAAVETPAPVAPVAPVAGIQTETPAVVPPAVADTGAGHRQTPTTPAPAVPAAPQGAANQNIPVTPDASRAAPPPPPPDTAELSASTGPVRAQDTALLVANSDRPAEALAAATSARPDAVREALPRKSGSITKASAPNAKPGAAQAPSSTMPANAMAEAGAPAPTAQAQNRLADLAASFAAMSINHPVGGASKFSANPVFMDSLSINGVAPVGLGEPGGVSTLAPATAASARAAAMAAPVVQQVAVRISQAVRDGATRITVQLRPADLGRIEIKLELGDSGRLSATVVVDRPETLDMMQRDARGLERALQQAGLDADSDSLQFSLRDDGDDAENPESDGLGDDPGQTAGPDDGMDDTDEITLAQGVTTMLQADGGLDIRV